MEKNNNILYYFAGQVAEAVRASIISSLKNSRFFQEQRIRRIYFPRTGIMLTVRPEGYDPEGWGEDVGIILESIIVESRGDPNVQDNN